MRGTHCISQLIQQDKMKVKILPALSDNYMYLVSMTFTIYYYRWPLIPYFQAAWLIFLPSNSWRIIWTLYFPWNRCVCSLQASFRIAIFGFIEEWFGSIFAYYSNLESYLSWLIKLSMASKLVSSACVENWDDCGEGSTQKIINFLDTDT